MRVRAGIEWNAGVRVRAGIEWNAGVRMRAGIESRAGVRASDEKNQRSSVRSRSHSHSDFVPCRLDLSNFMDDLNKIKRLRDHVKNMTP